VSRAWVEGTAKVWSRAQLVRQDATISYKGFSIADGATQRKRRLLVQLARKSLERRVGGGRQFDESSHVELLDGELLFEPKNLVPKPRLPIPRRKPVVELGSAEAVGLTSALHLHLGVYVDALTREVPVERCVKHDGQHEEAAAALPSRAGRGHLDVLAQRLQQILGRKHSFARIDVVCERVVERATRILYPTEEVFTQPAPAICIRMI